MLSMPRVLGQLVRVVRVAEILDGVVQHNVQKRVKSLECPATLPAPGELDPDLLVDKPAELRIDSFFFLSWPSPALLTEAIL